MQCHINTIIVIIHWHRSVCNLCVYQILNATANEQHNDAFHEIRLFSLFPAKSDMLWYDLRGIQLPWSVPREYSPLTHSDTQAIIKL